MYSIIKQLRKGGMRFKREGEAGPGVFGEVMLVHHNGYPCLQAKRWGDSSQDSQLLAPLYGAVCKNFQGKIMRWEGFQAEREGGPAYFQEWLVTFMSDRPSKDVIDGMRVPITCRGS